jgi:hypothetical protein
MRIKTLLLGSATVFAFAGGAAQAADLSVAEPVDYVRVCDAFGAGYWYIPGTDTCIKIGGEVEFRTYFYEDDTYLDDVEDHTASWKFRTSFDLNFTTKSMTDWGPLTTYINLTSATDNVDDPYGGDDPQGDFWVEADEYYLSLGPVLLGRTGSAFDIVGDGYAGDTNFKLDLSDDKADQVQLSWAINGFGLVVALEAPEDRWGSSAVSDMPDLVAALSASGTGWEAAVSFLYADLISDTQVAVQGNLEIDVWGDQLQLGALWADDGSGTKSTSSLAVEDGWAFLASYKHNWSANLYSAVAYRYIDNDNAGTTQNRVAFTTAFSPASGLWVGGDIGWTETSGSSDAFGVVLWAERTFGE